MQRTPRGNALFVAILLLLVASVATLLALNVGVQEQRTSGNALRATLVAEVAEAGIAQGVEFVRLHPALLATGLSPDAAAPWSRCADLADPLQFPCGAVADAVQRGTMSFWRNVDASGDINHDGTHGDVLDQRMLPLRDAFADDAARIAAVGRFDRVAYGVGLLRGPPAADGASQAYQLVSVASLPGEGARKTVSQAFGVARVFRANPHQPTLVASGSVDLTGDLHLVANANGGGHGVPVSVWTRKDATTAGPPNTCQAAEFHRGGERCESDARLSFDSAGQAHDEGRDILDHDGSTGANGKGMNADVPAAEFPCDLFAYVFGAVARIDRDGDAFCETLAATVAYTAPTTMQRVQLDADEAFLYLNASTIFPNGAIAHELMGPAQAWNGADPAALAGIVWCQSPCGLASSTQIGTPEKPVVLVIDGAAQLRGRVHGIVFLRTPRAAPAQHPLDGMHDHAGDKLDPASGGTAHLQLAGARVHGAVVVQGRVERTSGTAAIVHDNAILERLVDTIPARHAPLPGGWSDRTAY